MKNLLLLFLLISNFLVGQTVQSPIFQNEIGLNLFSITQFNFGKDNLDKRSITADLNFFSGIYYKKHFENNALRFSLDYNNKSINNSKGYETPYYFSEVIAASKKNLDMSFGLEHDFGSKKIHPYIFSDLVFGYQNFTGLRSEYGCFGPIGIYKFSEETFSYGVGAGAGIRYSLTDHIDLTAEFSAHAVYSVYQDVLNAGKKYSSLDYRINPLQKVGFAVKF